MFYEKNEIGREKKRERELTCIYWKSLQTLGKVKESHGLCLYGKKIIIIHMFLSYSYNVKEHGTYERNNILNEN